MFTCDHSDLFDFDCQNPCPTCNTFGPHYYSEDPYCDICGQPQRSYWKAIKNLLGFPE